MKSYIFFFYCTVTDLILKVIHRFLYFCWTCIMNVFILETEPILYSPSPGYMYKKCYLEYKWARMFSCCVIPIIYSYILTIYSANPFLLQKNLESLIVLYSICFVVRFCVYLKITKLHSRPSHYVAKIQLKQAFA